jgi:hypothetical protein
MTTSRLTRRSFAFGPEFRILVVSSISRYGRTTQR